MLSLVLKRDDEVGFQRYLSDVYDERSPRFHQFLNAAQIASEFGPSQQAYDDVAAWLLSQKVTDWKGVDPEMPTLASLKALGRGYLAKAACVAEVAQ